MAGRGRLRSAYCYVLKISSTLRLAGGGLGDRATTQTKYATSTLSRTLSRSLNITVTTVIAGQVKPISNHVVGVGTPWGTH